MPRRLSFLLFCPSLGLSALWRRGSPSNLAKGLDAARMDDATVVPWKLYRATAPCRSAARLVWDNIATPTPTRWGGQWAVGGGQWVKYDFIITRAKNERRKSKECSPLQQDCFLRKAVANPPAPQVVST
ncbi:hypothetical protein BDW42DRAFT_63773 [Aspergillus taichungensis]|uniref:Secreted protein n=1 Tax=Aspergillus taichungensis TaxID=482145 RepID=A0A2J5I148_9EURO|nr:hypothetical protein BDW42DRAFT_63773 [Aspergillus taichungensis]